MTMLNIMLTNVYYMYEYIMIFYLLAYRVVAHIRCSIVLMLFGCCIFFSLVKYLGGSTLLPFAC
jgi:hypothetical protein